MESTIKRRLLLYAVLSGAAFYIFFLSNSVGIGIPLFCLLQCVTLPLLLAGQPEVVDKKGFLFLVPLFVLSLNYFISGSEILWASNFLLAFLLLAVMTLTLNRKVPWETQSLDFLWASLLRVARPFRFLILPFAWLIGEGKGKTKVLARVFIALLITVPCLFFLVIALASADMVFLNEVGGWLKAIQNFFENIEIWKIILGVLAGLYLFGVAYSALLPAPEKEKKQASKPTGDMLVLGILLCAVLMVYSAFVFIQFRYLFAGAELPYGLSYADYARRGFFELVALSFMNIGAVLLYGYLLREKLYGVVSKSGRFVKALLLYLCTVTGVLLVSSFYRMVLYNNAYGYTRLRLLVIGFLFVEAAALVSTVCYVIKPKFNIFLTYAAIAFVFYMALNVIPIDSVIAKRNVDRYFAGEKVDMNYLSSLSTDAAPQIARLLSVGSNDARKYFEHIERWYPDGGADWRGYNLSVNRAKQIAKVHGIG